MTMAVTVFVI